MVRMVLLIIFTFTITPAIFASRVSLIVPVGCVLAFNIWYSSEFLCSAQEEDQNLLIQGLGVPHFSQC